MNLSIFSLSNDIVVILEVAVSGFIIIILHNPEQMMKKSFGIFTIILFPLLIFQRSHKG